MDKEYKNNYKTYLTEDFIQDPFFQEWVIAPSSKTTEFWKIWMDENPEKRAIILESRALLKELNNATKPDESDYSREINKIFETLDESHVKEINLNEETGNSNAKLVWAIAASFSLLMVAMVTYYFALNSNEVSFQQWQTAAGEIKDVELSDGTELSLRANSIVQQDAYRTITLVNGEIYLNVTKSTNQRKFSIRTRNSFVTVLGTAFSLYDREDSLSLELDEGKVSMLLATDSGDSTLLFLNPGDLISFDKENSFARISNQVSQRSSTWVNGDYQFKDSSVRDIIYTIRNTYGLDVEVSDELLEREITGQLPTDDSDLMVEILSNAIHANLSKENSKYILK